MRAGYFARKEQRDTLSYSMPGFVTWEAEVTLKNGILRHQHKASVTDTAGRVIGDMVIVVYYDECDKSIPESSWSTDPCPMVFE